MACDPLLLERVQKILTDEPVEKRSYPNGIGFLVNGNLACGVHEDFLIVQVGEDRYEEILTHPLSRPIDIEGKSTPGWVGIIPTGTKRDIDLAGWVKTGLEYAKELANK